jgi:hypothetical protein
MRLIGWLGVVTVGAVLLLTGAEGADDRRALPADGEVKALSQKLAALEARLRLLEGVVQVSGLNVRLVSGAGMTIQGGSGIAIQTGGTVAMSGGGTVDIRGATIQLNPGGRPLARMGDPVVVEGKIGQITGGSSTVLGQ